MRGCTQEKYLEAKLEDLTRTEGRDVTTLALFLQINYLIPGTGEISERVSGLHTRLHLFLMSAFPVQSLVKLLQSKFPQLRFATVSDCLERLQFILMLKLI